MTLAPATERLLRGYRGRWRGCREDLDQAVELARLEAEATGDDPDRLVRQSIRQTILDLAPGWRSPARPAHRRRTPGQRRRFLRNALITHATRAGFSTRQLGTIFGLAPQRISAIAGTFYGSEFFRAGFPGCGNPDRTTAPSPILADLAALRAAIDAAHPRDRAALLACLDQLIASLDAAGVPTT